MNNHYKKLAFLLLLAASLVTTAFVTEIRKDSKTAQSTKNNRVTKYTVYHNGHYLCLPMPAVIAHLREHSTDVFGGCCEDCPDKPEQLPVPPAEPAPTPAPTPSMPPPAVTSSTSVQ